MSQLPVAPPPHNADAERSVLGAMFLDGEAVLLALDELVAEDFYIAAHQEIFSSMAALGLRGRPVDLVTLAEELTRRGTLMGVGGIPYLTDLSRYVPSAANAGSYIRIVSEKSTLRKLADAGKTIHSESIAARDDAPGLLERAEKLIYDIAMKRGADKLEPLRPALYQAYAQIEELVTTKGAITGVASGFAELDEMTTGFHAGELILVGSRPSMGKSTFAMNMAQSAALAHGKKVAVFSLEMPREQLAMRMICGDARVDMQQARKGRIADDEWVRLAGSMNRLAESGVWIDDSPMVTVSHIKSRCRRLQIEHGLDLIIIDYLQLMTAVKSSDSRQQEVSDISRGLKLLAQELRVPIIALSQLSRAPQRRTDNRPMLSDLRDSGAIEQDADVVMFLYRDEYYNPDTEEKNIAEVILSKQRNGPLGTVKLAFLGQYALFVNLPPGTAARS